MEYVPFPLNPHIPFRPNHIPSRKSCVCSQSSNKQKFTEILKLINTIINELLHFQMSPRLPVGQDHTSLRESSYIWQIEIQL